MTVATKLTPKKADKFLATLAQCGNVTAACAAVSTTRYTVYGRREKDEDFARRWDEAVEASADKLEAEAWRRAHDGIQEPWSHGGKVYFVKKYSDVLLIFLLKGLRPKKYRDNWSGQLSGPNGGPIPLQAEASELTDAQLIAIAAGGITESRDSAAVAQQAHNQQVSGSTPDLATNESKP